MRENKGLVEDEYEPVGILAQLISAIIIISLLGAVIYGAFHSIKTMF